MSGKHLCSILCLTVPCTYRQGGSPEKTKMNEEKKALPTRPHLSLEIHKKSFEVCIQVCTLIKQKRFKKIAWIQSHYRHLQFKFKLLTGKFTYGNKAKHCKVMSTNFLFSKVCLQSPAMLCLYTSTILLMFCNPSENMTTVVTLIICMPKSKIKS